MHFVIWSAQVFHLKLCFPLKKNNHPGQYCCILPFFYPSCLLSGYEIRHQISSISLTQGFDLESVLLKKEQLELHGIY